MHCDSKKSNYISARNFTKLGLWLCEVKDRQRSELSAHAGHFYRATSSKLCVSSHDASTAENVVYAMALRPGPSQVGVLSKRLNE